MSAVSQIEEEILIWKSVEEGKLNYISKIATINEIEISYYTEEYRTWVEEYVVNLEQIAEGMI